MKALTERLIFLQSHLWQLPDGPDKTSLLDIWIECNAIAEALPEITLPDGWEPPPPPKSDVISVVSELTYESLGDYAVTDDEAYVDVKRPGKGVA